MPAGTSSEAGGEKISWQRGVKLSPAAQVSVEECCLAIREKVGCNSVKFASQMNSAVVIFLDSVNKFNSVVESGVVIRDLFTQVLPLASPARRVLISNDGVSHKIGKTWGKIPPSKSCFYLQKICFHGLKNNEANLNLVWKFKVENLITQFLPLRTSDLKCFKCGQEGHFARF